MKTVFKAIVFFIFISVELSAQQNNLFNTYLYDPLQLNIANAADDCIEANLNYRNQWTGLKDAPKLYQLNAHLPFKEHAGLALRVSSEQMGLYNILQGTIGYGYRIKFDARSQLMFGLGIGFTQSTLNTNKVVVLDGGDATLAPEGKQTATGIDTEFGVLYKNDKLKAGVSVLHLYNNSPDFVASSYKVLPQLNASISYLFNKGEKLEFEPLLVDRFTVNGTNALEAMLNFHISKMFTIAPGYRMNYGVLIFAGVKLSKIKVAYSFDYRIASNSAYRGSSHQVLLGFNLCKPRKKPASETKKVYDKLGGSQ